MKKLVFGLVAAVTLTMGMTSCVSVLQIAAGVNAIARTAARQKANEAVKPHSFVGEGNSDAATISFANVSYGTESDSWVQFVSYGDVVRQEGENWTPVIFPVGAPLAFTVEAYYFPAGGTAQIIKDKQVLFECPPLEAGKSYILWFVKSDGGTGKGTNTLVLTEAMQEDFIKGNGDALIMALKIRDKLQVVYEQEFTK
ncbi:hypothetical protein FACS189483_03940 [Spirochaetia bacterium]|nr:hypothetical protein FACS189483_03940 [Spirochaetia bacterium]